MSYEDFSVQRLQYEFSLTVQDVPNLFGNTSPVEPSERLRAFLEESVPLGTAIGTEKARSEFIIAPILAEIKKRAGGDVSLFSGNRFDVDKEKGLTGYCDFLFSFSPSQVTISAPVLAIVEAENENINTGFGQCMAEMLAAGIYNRAMQRPMARIYGCVTTGSVWRFLQLEDNTVSLDGTEYYLDQLSKILGVFLACLRR
uniref:Uncharacterized protein n=1 Tax=Candidatus Kentrum sp. MB TaxID=2138164 RepID=A0A450XGF0_9GAMM|nr:MAG: hypothetical protein BECKMB1821G_GA0114241_103624 [Candidatus Kentron sp. MB]